MLVWYPMGVRNEAEAEIAIAIATPIGFRPVPAASDKPIGNISSAAALLVIISVSTTVARTIPSNAPRSPKPPNTDTIPLAASAASPVFSMAAARPKAAAMMTITSRSIERRASVALSTPKATISRAPTRAPTKIGTISRVARTITAARIATATQALAVDTGAGGVAAMGAMSRKSSRSLQRSLKPGSESRISVSPRRRRTWPSLASMSPPSRWIATTAAWYSLRKPASFNVRPTSGDLEPTTASK